jgi:hypothetical protein
MSCLQHRDEHRVLGEGQPAKVRRWSGVVDYLAMTTTAGPLAIAASELSRLARCCEATCATVACGASGEQ